MKIICDGDSWTFGSEILNPSLNKIDDWEAENDEFRLKRIYPTYLSKLFDCDVLNLSWPADDNGSILRRTINFITSNYLAKNVPTDDLFVIIGWSSPERHSFWYKDDKFNGAFRLWPQVQYFDRPPQEDFWKLYVTYLWNREEYLPRYVMNVLQFQNFCDSNNIKWLCFNAFYQTPERNPQDWEDMSVKEELSDLNVHGNSYSENDIVERNNHQHDFASVWETIDSVRFYKKDKPNNTFRSFIEKTGPENAWNNWHPSPKSHQAWANELYSYIDRNNLL